MSFFTLICCTLILLSFPEFSLLFSCLRLIQVKPASKGHLQIPYVRFESFAAVISLPDARIRRNPEAAPKQSIFIGFRGKACFCWESMALLPASCILQVANAAVFKTE